MPITIEQLDAEIVKYQKKVLTAEDDYSAEPEWEPHDGYTQSDSGELHRIPGHARWAREEPRERACIEARSNRQPEPAQLPQPAPGLDEWDAGDDPGPIPPRQWLLGNQFCREFISSIVAAGGAGKSALRLVQYISMALGRSLC